MNPQTPPPGGIPPQGAYPPPPGGYPPPAGGYYPPPGGYPPPQAPAPNPMAAAKLRSASIGSIVLFLLWFVAIIVIAAGSAGTVVASATNGDVYGAAIGAATTYSAGAALIAISWIGGLVCNIVLAVRASAHRAFNQKFEVVMALAIVGCFFPLFGMIAGAVGISALKH